MDQVEEEIQCMDQLLDTQNKVLALIRSMIHEGDVTVLKLSPDPG